MSESQHVREFIRLFTRHEPALRGYILAMIPNWNDAEDVLQQTNTVLWEKFSQFEQGTSFLAWARQIARFEVLHWRRAQSRDRLRFSDDFANMVADETEAMESELSTLHESLVQCFAELPEKDQELTRLRYVQQLSAQGTADRLGRKLDAIYKALARIRRTLFECIQRKQAEEARA